MNADFSERDISFMRLALYQAELSLQCGEIPVGCVFVNDETGAIVSSGYNKTNESRNGTRHAELVSMDKLLFCSDVGVNFTELSKCSLYVTCEPCIMCAAAIAKVGIKKVYFGCHNDRFGGNGSILSIHADQELSIHSYEVIAGLLKDEAIELFQRFYESENRRAPDSKRRKKQGCATNSHDNLTQS